MRVEELRGKLFGSCPEQHHQNVNREWSGCKDAETLMMGREEGEEEEGENIKGMYAQGETVTCGDRGRGGGKKGGSIGMDVTVGDEKMRGGEKGVVTGIAPFSSVRTYLKISLKTIRNVSIAEPHQG